VEEATVQKYQVVGDQKKFENHCAMWTAIICTNLSCCRGTEDRHV